MQGVRTPPCDEAFFFIFAFEMCLPHQSVTPFLSGTPSPEKNPGSFPVDETLVYDHLRESY